MDSSVDVSDLMVELLCKGGCSDKECAESDGMDGGPWSHSKLMDCIRKKWINREDLVKLEAFLDQAKSTEYPDRGYSYYPSTRIDTVKQRLKEILA